jgi:cobalt-zinc-cadmium efflux system membrane fusion protein
MKKQLILLSIFTLFFLLSCNNKTSEDNETENNFIEITKEQFLSEKMAIGTPKKIAIEERISFTGKVVPKLNGGSVIINAPVEGIVMDIHVQPGQDIRLNETLFEIGGSAVIDLQQEFASSSAKIKQLQANFNRAKELYKENINTENDFMLAESLYKSELANYNALKLKLQNIGLNTSNIENGNYAATYRIKAPINGQISQITCVKGQFISAEHQIAEVVNKNIIELKLAFFEKDFSKITKGQKVKFRSLNQTEQNSNAIIDRIGNKLNINSNTFDCYAKIDEENTTSYAINQLIRGEVILTSDSVFAVPQTAVLSSGNQKYVFIVVSENEKVYRLEKVNIKIGKTDKKHVELIDFEKDNQIIIDGAYNLVME